MIKFRATLLFGALLALALPANATDGAVHGDPVAHVVIALAIIIGAAKIGAHFAVKFGQAAVLGELFAGVLLGNLDQLGLTGVEAFSYDPSIDMLARLGVLILLFEVGLESTVKQMLKVGLSSFFVAVLGVVVPFVLGWGVSRAMLPNASQYVHSFIGATLTATSVGITARVLKDLNRSQTQEARIILGAAVIDDVLGLVILAVVVGIIAAADHGATLSYGDIGLTLGKSLGFLVGAIALGVWLIPRIFRTAFRLKSSGVLLALGLVFCFILSWAANAIGLAPIVGSFAAGLILEDIHYKDFVNRGEHKLEEAIEPIASFLVPIFFVITGMRTDLRAFSDVNVLGLAAALTVVAILGKQVCAFGVVRGTSKIDRLSVGLGMIPRGEVGLIFANIGATLTIKGERIVNQGTFSAVVIMVIITTLITPSLLKWSLGRLAPQVA